MILDTAGVCSPFGVSIGHSILLYYIRVQEGRNRVAELQIKEARIKGKEERYKVCVQREIEDLIK